MDPTFDQPGNGGSELEPLFIPPPLIAASSAPEPAPEPAPTPAVVAPAWHTVVLLAFIFAVSLRGAAKPPLAHVTAGNYRLVTYAVTAVFQLVLLGWVAFGLYLGKTPLRSILGNVSGKIRAILLDIGIALVFWFASLMVLGTLAVFWLAVQTAVAHPQTAAHTPFHLAPDPTQQKVVRALGNLAPGSGAEFASWILLCLLVGASEELVFRGYLLRQFTAWARGATAAGVVFSSLVFGAAHGYEGVRNMFLLTVFGVLFALLALLRRNLRAGMFAHSWHDIVIGLALAFFRSHRLL